MSVVAAPLAPVGRVLLRDQALTRIRTAIVSGELAPGSVVKDADLAARLGLHTEPVEGAKIVVVDGGSVTAGVVVDDVDEVLTIEDGQLDDVPAAGSDSIEGIAKVGDRLVVLLNTEGIFGGVELAVAA